MTQQEKETPKRKFTDEQIAQIKAKLLKNPHLMNDLLSNAQSGNQDDLSFIVEADLMLISEDKSKSSSVLRMHPSNR